MKKLVSILCILMLCCSMATTTYGYIIKTQDVEASGMFIDGRRHMPPDICPK